MLKIINKVRILIGLPTLLVRPKTEAIEQLRRGSVFESVGAA
jgi:hypothetical protein